MTLICVSFSGAAAAADKDKDQTKRGPVPGWVVRSELMPVPENARGVMFSRRQDFLVHLDKKGQAIYTGYRLKILHPNALQLGNLSIVWSPEAGAPIIHTIKIYRGDEVIDVLKGAQFNILQREDQLEVAMLDGRLTAVMKISDLRVGDELEVELTTFASDPTLGSDTSGILYLAPTPPPGRYHLGVGWDQGQEPSLKMGKDLAAVVQKGDSKVDFRFDNPPTLTSPKDAPARFGWQRMAEYSDFQSWNMISQRFAALFAKAEKFPDSSPLKREADRIAAAHSSAFDRAAAALKLVQQDVRYIYVGMNGGNFTPAAADTTWQRRYGDCKAKTVLLLALLDRLGIEAEPVLASNAGTDDGLDERLPSPQMFDHVLVRAHIDGASYYLDGTLPPVARPVIDPVMPYKWVLPLTAQGSGLENLKFQPSKTPDSITLYEIDARAGFDEPAKQVQTTILRGLEGLKEQVRLSPMLPDEMTSAFRQALVGDDWQSVDDVQWHYDERAQASVLTISGTSEVDWDDDGGGAKSLALPGGGYSAPGKRIRASDQDQDAPYYDKRSAKCSVTTVRLPSATKPKQWSFNTSYDQRYFGTVYHRVFGFRDGIMRMISSDMTEHEETDAASARQDNERLAKFDNSKAWIYYDPDGEEEPDKGEDIPTTDGIDWTADDIPCLAPGNPESSSMDKKISDIVEKISNIAGKKGQ